MNPIEKRLKKHKDKLDELKVPEELEDRMEKALTIPPERKGKRMNVILKIMIAAVIIVVFVAGYNHNALAYYSKKILGFDDYYGKVFQLNNEEMGQVIEKTIELEEGLYFTVNGIMTDPNQLVMFYTFSAPSGIDGFKDTWQYNMGSISGFMTNSGAHGGSGYESEDRTEIKGIYYFDPVNPLATKLTLHIWKENGIQEITFPHDPNKAMKANVDTPINQTLQLDKGSITFDTIIASPTMTLLKGSIDNENEADLHESLIGIQVLANGLTVGRDRSTTITEDGSTTFEISYNALPYELDNLKVFLNKFIGYKDINDKISLKEGNLDEMINFHGQEISVKDVKKQSKYVEITISTDEDVMLDGLSIGKDGVSAEITLEEYDIQNRIERTYKFDTSEIPKSLFVEGIYYMKPYEKAIEIPNE